MLVTERHAQCISMSWWHYGASAKCQELPGSLVQLNLSFSGLFIRKTVVLHLWPLMIQAWEHGFVVVQQPLFKSHEKCACEKCEKCGFKFKKNGVKWTWWMEQMLESLGEDEGPGLSAPRGLALDGCLPDRWPLRAPSFTSVCLNAHPSVVFGIRNCCAVWHHRLMITHLFCHTSWNTLWIQHHTEGKKQKRKQKMDTLYFSFPPFSCD